MFIFLSKLLPLFVYPVGLAVIALLGALLLRNRMNWQSGLAAVALLVLFLGGNRWVAMGLMRSLEWRHLPEGDAPAGQVAVVLGGGTRPAGFPRPTPEVNEAGDRLLYAAWLYQNGSVEMLLLAGGGIEWQGADDVEREAESMAAILTMMGVPEDAMRLDVRSRNTYENGVESKRILDPTGVTDIVLVTSASHMPRSIAVFEKQGFNVVPAPTDFRVAASDWQQLTALSWQSQLLALIPTADNLELTTRALKEYIGLAVYKARGWA